MLSKIIGEFQESRNLEDLKRHMQALSEQYGFSSYNFIDAGNLVDEVPYYMTTVETSWEETYRDNNFVDIDPYISLARRSNTPFTWGALPTDKLRSRGPKRATSRLMEIHGLVAAPAGVTIDDLVSSTGWQPHTLRAAFSRLRRRGFPIVHATDTDGRKAYRLAVREG